MSYHADRFFAAVSVLVTHGPIKQRLMRAYEEYLEEIEQDELPVAVQESFAGLRRLMHGVTPANGEGPICASVRKMSKVEADRCAELLVEIFRDVVKYADDTQTLLPLVDEEISIVPPFLVKSG